MPVEHYSLALTKMGGGEKPKVHVIERDEAKIVVINPHWIENANWPSKPNVNTFRSQHKRIGTRGY